MTFNYFSPLLNIIDRNLTTGDAMDATYTTLRKVALTIFLVSFIVLLSACANSRKSSQKISEAEATIEQAESLEAMDYATEEYTEAKRKLEEARQFAEKGKHKKALLKANEAIADAKLAETKTLSEKAKKDLRELQASIQSLKDKLEKIKEEQD
ncbi:MAG: DUF4398 domain-containing protein [Balneolaceae bacterium]